MLVYRMVLLELFSIHEHCSCKESHINLACSADRRTTLSMEGTYIDESIRGRIHLCWFCVDNLITIQPLLLMDNIRRKEMHHLWTSLTFEGGSKPFKTYFVLEKTIILGDKSVFTAIFVLGHQGFVPFWSADNSLSSPCIIHREGRTRIFDWHGRCIVKSSRWVWWYLLGWFECASQLVGFSII